LPATSPDNVFVNYPFDDDYAETFQALVELTSFSLRIPKTLAASIEVTAKRLGMSKSEYARRAMEEFEQRLMEDRIAELSRRLAAHSASAARSMEGRCGTQSFSPKAVLA
jgi:hypothetical protein